MAGGRWPPYNPLPVTPPTPAQSGGHGAPARPTGFVGKRRSSRASQTVTFLRSIKSRRKLSEACDNVAARPTPFCYISAP